MHKYQSFIQSNPSSRDLGRANIVEGYALESTLQFRKHLRIAMGSAAEAECLVRAASELNYLSGEVAVELENLLGGTMRVLRGLLRLPIKPQASS